MAQVTLTIGGRVHAIACRGGEEAHLQRLGRLIDARAVDAARAAGNAGPERMMLLIALMLADDLDEVARRPAPPAAPAPAVPEASDAAAMSDRREAEQHVERTLAIVADRLEAVALALETDGASS